MATLLQFLVIIGIMVDFNFVEVPVGHVKTII